MCLTRGTAVAILLVCACSLFADAGTEAALRGQRTEVVFQSTGGGIGLARLADPAANLGVRPRR